MPLSIEVARLALQAGFWAAVAFPIITAFFWPWWTSSWGWNIISLEAAIGLALLEAVLYVEFGLKPGHTPLHILGWTEAAALWMVPVIIVWRGIIIWHTQRHPLPPDYAAMAAELREQGYTVIAPRTAGA
jgi:hypothetical protein